VDEDCGSFVISSKFRANQETSNSKGMMTDLIKYEDKKIETRGETKAFSE